MGEVVAARCCMRAWGSDKYLDNKMFKAGGGASKETWVYVVGGACPEPLLGDEDAGGLGSHQLPSIGEAGGRDQEHQRA